MSVRVLVCGGRNYTDKDALFLALDRLHAEYRFTCLIHGAAHGADDLADRWATSREVCIERYAANWKTYGRAAGPVRNQRMLKEGRPELVIAFQGGRGTENMIRQATKAGVKVTRIAP